MPSEFQRLPVAIGRYCRAGTHAQRGSDGFRRPEATARPKRHAFARIRFAAPEAAALSSLIGYWLEPRRNRTLQTVLTSGIFGYDAQQLHDFNQNESEILHWAESARTALDNWNQYGIFAAMQQFSQHTASKRAS